MENLILRQNVVFNENNEKLFEITSEIDVKNQDMIDYIVFLCWEIETDKKEHLEKFAKTFKKEFKNFEIKILKNFEEVIIEKGKEKLKDVGEVSKFFLEKTKSWKIEFIFEKEYFEEEFVNLFPNKKEIARNFFNTYLFEDKIHRDQLVPSKDDYSGDYENDDYEESFEDLEERIRWKLKNLNIFEEEFLYEKTSLWKEIENKIDNSLKNYSFYKEWETANKILHSKHLNLTSHISFWPNYNNSGFVLKVEWSFDLKNFVFDNFKKVDFDFLKENFYEFNNNFVSKLSSSFEDEENFVNPFCDYLVSNFDFVTEDEEIKKIFNFLKNQNSWLKKDYKITEKFYDFAEEVIWHKFKYTPYHTDSFNSSVKNNHLLDFYWEFLHNLEVDVKNETITYKFKTNNIIGLLLCQWRTISSGAKIGNEIALVDLVASFYFNNVLENAYKVKDEKEYKNRIEYLNQKKMFEDFQERKREWYYDHYNKDLFHNSFHKHWVHFNKIAKNSWKKTLREFLNGYLNVSENFEKTFPYFKKVFENLKVNFSFETIQINDVEELWGETKIVFSYKNENEDFKKLMGFMPDFQGCFKNSFKRNEILKLNPKFLDEMKYIFLLNKNRNFLNIWRDNLAGLNNEQYDNYDKVNGFEISKLFFDEYMRNELPKDKFQLFKLLREWGLINENMKTFHPSLEKILN